MKQSRVFEETYQGYLAAVRQIDYLSRADLLGVQQENGALVIPLYDQLYFFSESGVGESTGAAEVPPAVRVILCKYIQTCPSELPQMPDTFMTYREFKGASPLISYFTTNTNKIIESSFAGNLTGLKERSAELGGVEQSSDSHDFSVLFYALPRIPVLLNFNDRDELFPATCSVLYRASAEQYLDMECLAMTGTLLAGKLTHPGKAKK